MSRVRDITKFLEETRKTNTNLKALRPSTTSTIDSAAVLVMKSASGMSVFSTLDSLPVTNLTTGQQAYVTETSRIYVSNGNGWYNVAVVNATPALTLSSSGTIALTAGAATTITMTATDSDNADANLVLSLESGGDLFKFATVSRDSSVVTITPRTQDSATTLGYDGSATLTFKASDGVNQATVQNTFTLSFTLDWSSVTSLTGVGSDAAQGNQFGNNNRIPVSSDGTVFAVGGAEGWTVVRRTGSTLSFDTSSGSNSSYSGLMYWGSRAADPHNCSAINSAGNRLLIGNPLDNTAGTSYGSFAIFTESSGTWTQAQTVNGTAENDFAKGGDMSADGNYLAIGQSKGGSESGIIVYKWGGSSYSSEATVSRPTNYSGGGRAFGQSILLSSDGSYMFVADHDYSSTAYGRIYVYKRTGTSWSLDATVATGANNYDRLGSAIATNSDMTVIAATSKSFNTNTGYCKVYSRPSNTSSSWSLQATVTQPTPSTSSYFGSVCALDSTGTILVVGGRPWHVGTHPLKYKTRLYTYQYADGSWTNKNTIISATTAQGPFEGVGISSDGKFIAGGDMDHEKFQVFTPS